MSLFNSWYTKSHAIEEFEVAQNQTLDQAGNGLRDNWVTAVQLAFKSSFKDVGESALLCECLHCRSAMHFNVYEHKVLQSSNTKTQSYVRWHDIACSL